MSNHRAAADIIPFFDNMPEQVIPLAARLWDEAVSPNYNGQTAYQDFALELRYLNIEPPPRAIAKRWIAGVQAKLIKRPGGPEPTWLGYNEILSMDMLPDVHVEQETPSTRPVDALVSTSNGDQIRPVLAAEVDPKTRRINILGIAPVGSKSVGDMDAFAAKLFDATLAEIQQEATAKAAKLVASRLREIADKYDALVA
ncbi:hypothetical protein RMR16_008815 [Agrobacterium sp. rho-13.3]|uniref:hypothetical protein n=1 Tax=Agrobacterium sp. rho-13.3 TaxID=3072980 RepID=UPI002A0CC227|nr:hypothetical protein [Agrobacterium sp. rho-13.3]MDX8310052.1 hypothetical protein [Agrobacterium sp. rho-13.3]